MSKIQVEESALDSIKRMAQQLQDERDELLAALKQAARCLAWHEEKRGVGMDRFAVEKSFSAIAKAESNAQNRNT